MRMRLTGEWFEVGQLSQPWPDVFDWRAEELENPFQLVVDVGAREKRSSSVGELSENATS